MIPDFLPQNVIANFYLLFQKEWRVCCWRSSMMQYIEKSTMQGRQIELKTIYLQQDQTKTSQVFTITTSPFDKFFDFTRALATIPRCAQKEFQIFSPQHNQYIPLNSICTTQFFIPREYAQLSVVMIKCLDEQQTTESFSSQEEGKKQRSKERLIRDVIELVKRWRELTKQLSGSKRLNLQESAKIIGISKKSLDDYYFQLRMGEKYQFDFSSHMRHKIGTLRSFVKTKEIAYKNDPNKKINNNKGQNKQLKLIQEFERKLNISNPHDEPQVHSHHEQIYKKKSDLCEKSKDIVSKEKKKIECGFNCSHHFDLLIDSEQLFWGSPFSPIDEKDAINCEFNFFKDFEIQQENDPFIMRASFSKIKSIFNEQYPSDGSPKTL